MSETIIGRYDGVDAPRRSGETRYLNVRPKPLAFLVFVSGVQAGTPLMLHGEVTRIGRDGDANEYAIDDDAVSSRHLSIRFRDSQFVLTDLDTANGTKVNGQPVDRQVLASNDVITIGRTRLAFLRVEDDVDPDA